MSKTHTEITAEISTWLSKQHMFFVATAPLAGDGLVNCSPKGMDALRILGPRTVAYLDLTGSGIETVAHLRENGRIVLMFCAFDGLPKIVRLHGAGEVVTPDSAEWNALRSKFPDHVGARAIVRVAVTRISDSCGYAVPLYDYREQRDVLTRSLESWGEAGIRAYSREKNARSIDGLPGLDFEH
jgi:hypothetical protein